MQNGKDLMDFRLHQIRQPTLVVWGSRDDLIPLATGEAIHSRIEGSRMAVIDGCGHMAPLECWRPVEEGFGGFSEGGELGGIRSPLVGTCLQETNMAEYAEDELLRHLGWLIVAGGRASG